MSTLTFEQFKKKYQDPDRGGWSDHPHYDFEDWQYEVANNDTRIGYWEWAYNQYIDDPFL